MSFTAIEVDGPGGERIVVAQTDGTAISAHVGPDRVVRMAPGLLGVTGGQPYIDPQGATVGEQATLGYDPASGSLFIELATDPAVIGLKLARAQRDRTASAPKPVRPAKARPAGRPSGQPRRAKVRRQAQTLTPDLRSHASRAAARTVVTLPTNTVARDQREQGRHMATERTAV